MAAPAARDGDLARRCAALGPPQPSQPPASACRVPPTLFERLRPVFVPGGRWFEPAPRAPGSAAPPRRPPPQQRHIPPRLVISLRPAGCIDTSIFRRMFREQQKELRCCLLASPPSQPTTLVRIRFTLPCRGRAGKVQVTGEPPLTPRVTRCLAEVVASWQFPALRPGEVVQVSYPLRYVPHPPTSAPGSAESPGSDDDDREP